MNAEIRALRDLLPLPEEAKEDLSYLHTMALACLRMRGPLLGAPGPQGPSPPPPGLDLLPALPGFVLAFSAEGKLLSISDNVVDYLGFSMVDLLAQGDTIYQLMDTSEVEGVREKLAEGAPGTETAFVCHLQSEKLLRMRYGRNRAVLIRGRFLPTTPIFIALCTPLVHGPEEVWLTPCTTFQSQHTLEMRLMAVTDSVVHHLGYSARELIGRSWYSLLSPEDLCAGTAQHKELLRDAESADLKFVVRMLSKELSHVWVQVTATREKCGHIIRCSNRVLREEEARYLSQDYRSGGDDAQMQRCSLMDGTEQPRVGLLALDSTSDTCSQATTWGVCKRKTTIEGIGQPGRKRARVLKNSSSPPIEGPTHELQLSDMYPEDTFPFTPPYTPESDSSSLLGFEGAGSPSSDMTALADDSRDLLSVYQSGTDSMPSPDFSDMLAGPLASVQDIAISVDMQAAFPMTMVYNLPETSPIKDAWDDESSIAFSSPHHHHALVPDFLLWPEEEVPALAEPCFYPSSTMDHEAFLLSPDDLDFHAFPGLVGRLSTDTPLPGLEVPPLGHGRPQYMENEWQEISLLATQLSAMAESFSLYCRPDHKGLQARMASSMWGTPPEPSLDESTISCILQDLYDMRGGPRVPQRTEAGGNRFPMGAGLGDPRWEIDSPEEHLLLHASTVLDARLPASPRHSDL
ncbi:neuronal PAS domain-containing protein 4-like [Ambystoma mexicanum]|uniref:neuronal PAS domain-containing protein 4-like n=1 Tax=Ambystoma mexicanum TaxID=8296 RepID=UPI0037E85911